MLLAAGSGERGGEVVEHLAAIPTLRNQLVAHEEPNMAVAVDAQPRAQVKVLLHRFRPGILQTRPRFLPLPVLEYRHAGPPVKSGPGVRRAVDLRSAGLQP